ncbi:hypothetical protein Nepgr_029428 [Nepenthes gracilis]|uniref:Pentatricopeptide repeat-containing protein n=1 Tax=Nepenthes gracilis TaxID=150966 RepID=A0AAD3Y4U3_NEPGR|nr:hypothetical protein Nepgr_029428 [Nepenthes gracilis]
MMKLNYQAKRSMNFSLYHKPQQQRRARITLPTYLQSPMHSFETEPIIASVHSIFSNPCYLLLGRCRNFISLRKIHALLIVHGLADDLLCKTKLVSLYGSFGCVRFARTVFDGIENPDLYSYKVMIRWYFLNELYPETVQFYNCLRKCLRENDDIVFSIVLKACCELRDIEEGRQVHCNVIKAGSADSFVLTSLVDMYAKCGEIKCAEEVFNEITDGNVVSWTSLIAGYVQNDCVEEALILFNRMRDGLVEGNQFTLGSLVTGCGKLGALHQGKWLHGFVIKTGISLESFLATALLDMYVKCGNAIDARSVFDCLSEADLVSWTAMIVGYTQLGHPSKALKLLVDKRWIGILPNSVTTASVLSASAQLGHLNMGKTVHCLAVKLNLEEVAVKNALLDMYAKCHAVGDAWYLFDSILEKDVVAWNSMISGYYQNGYIFHALQLFHRMITESESPDAVTLVSVMSACASFGTISIGSSLHAYFRKIGISSLNAYVGTALLNFYAKCGDTISARRVFDEMGEKNAVSWSAMISGYGMYGDADESLALFGNMSRENVEPNEVVFTTILSACSHTGKIGEGWKCFSSMCQKYNFVPSMKHYACMVDIFARAGRLKEALDLIEKMPIHAGITVYGAFLHGCSLHSQFDLGDVAARKILDMHPDEACYYVLLANYYALDGRWKLANEVRDLMKQRGLSKSPGWSSAEIERAIMVSPVKRFSYLTVNIRS